MLACAFNKRSDGNMLLQCGLLLLLGLARTTGNVEASGISKGFDRSLSFSNWPSLHNGASMWRIRKREIEQGNGGPSEGGGKVVIPADSLPLPTLPPAKPLPTGVPNPPLPPSNGTTQDDKSKSEKPIEVSKVPELTNLNSTSNATVPIEKDVKNGTLKAQKLDLSGPGVVKRGVIVFGGFALLAVAYFIFYRKKGSKNDAGSSHTTIDANQFRYGVLQSEDRRDNLELSRIPLTMESDEDEDDDLEIFDLEQKRKSMSYVNLQVNDEEIVNGPGDSSNSNDRENLLLDIEDVNSEALINWSSSGNKSIL